MNKMVLTALTAAFLLLPVLGTAEDGKTNRKLTILDEVVVKATKTEELGKDVSNNFIILDAVDINDSPARGIGDLLGGETGLDWRTRGDYGGAAQEIQIRGMGADGTQVLVNGLPVNSPSLGSSDFSKIPANNIERIEVVKGSGSVLYGSGAMGGIVNIITKSPKHDRVDLGVSAGYGTEQTYQISAENGMFLTDHFGYYLTANRYKTDGFRDNADADSKDASLKLVYENANDFQVSLFGDIIDQEKGTPGPIPPPGTQPFAVNGIPVYGNESASLLNHGMDKDKHLVLKIHADLLDRLGMNLQADYTDMESDSVSRYYSAATLGNLPGTHTIVTNKVMGLEGNIEVRPIEKSTVLLGVQYKDYDWENISNTLDGYGNPASTLTGKNNLHSTGVFAEVHYRPVKYIKGTLGIRHEDHSEFGSENLPRLGLILNPTNTTAVRFNTGKHFKAPTPNDLFWPYEDWGWGMGAQGNTDLKPETGSHTDIGIEQGFLDRKINASLTYFKWDIDDKIEWVPDVNYFYTPENISKYEASGIEAGLKIGPFYNTLLELSYTHMDATEQKQGGVQRQARYTSDDFFKAGLTYCFDFGLDITAVYRYTSDRPAIYGSDTDATPTKTLSSYSTIDVKANQRIGKNWSVSCQVNNLLDEAYDTYVQNFTDSTGTSTLSMYQGAGRSFFASVNYSF